MKRLLVLFFTLFVACGPRRSSRSRRSTNPLRPRRRAHDEPLPLDARVKKGKLANGLTYYVLQHKKPEQRAQIWLAVNAGSVLEDDDQRGLAHFVEHMGFNGTKRFPKQAIVDMLEKSGVAFGADLNAYTIVRRDRLHARRSRPTSPSSLDKAIDVLRDWARRRHVRSRSRSRRSAASSSRSGASAAAPGMRIFDKQAPVLFHGSQVRRAPHDRQAGDHQERAARHARALLQGLVPARI